MDYPKPPKPNPENRGMIPKDLRRQGISLPILPENSGDFRSKRKADQGVELAIFRSRVRRRTTYANRPNRRAPAQFPGSAREVQNDGRGTPSLPMDLHTV